MPSTSTPEQIEALLWSEVIGRIGCHLEGRIYIVPIHYVYDGHHAYMQSADGLKLQAMRRDPAVCFEVEQVSGLWSWQSVIAHGVFEELVADDAERARKLMITRLAPLMKGENPWPVDFTPTAGGPLEARVRAKTLFFRLALHEKTGRFEHP